MSNHLSNQSSKNLSTRRKTVLPIAQWGLILVLALGALMMAGIAYGAAPGSTLARQTTPTVAAPTLTPTVTPTDAPTVTPPLPTASPTEPAPTLVPPTPLPTQSAPAVALAETSALSSVQKNGEMRVGILYNAYPFAWLNEQGFIDGYEADLLRTIAIELGVQISFTQITRHNAEQMLLTGQVDLIAGQQIAAHDRTDTLAFVHPYYVNQERMVIRQDSSYVELPQLAGQPVAVEVGSRSEAALRQWMAETGINIDVRPYFTESEALDALAAGEVEGMVGTLDSLRRAGRQQMSLISEPVMIEPYSIAVRRTDADFLDLLDRSLQRLKASGRVEDIYAQWFGQEPMDFYNMIPVYDRLYQDERTLDDFGPADTAQEHPIMARIENGESVRIAGIDIADSAPVAVKVMNNFNRSLVEEMARRWGVTAEILPDSAITPLPFVASGAAELAVGVTPRWDGNVPVEYSLPYLERGNRVLVPERAQVNSFFDLLGTGWYIGYFADTPGDEEMVKKYAEAYGVADNITLFQINREDDAIYTMTVQDNIDMLYGDNLRLEGLVRAAPGSQVRMLDGWYGDLFPVAFAMPQTDTAFVALVNTTLQQMAEDGTYARLWNEQFGIGQPLNIVVWPQVAPRP